MDHRSRGGDDPDHLALVEQLVKFGLTRSEAKAYTTLLQFGEAKAESVARYSKIPRQEAYRVLARLEERELVYKVISNPLRFRTIPPQLALAKLIEDEQKRAEERLKELYKIKDDAISRFTKIKNHLNEERNYFYSLQGKQIFEREVELMRYALEEIRLAGSAYDLAKLYHQGATPLFKTGSKMEVQIICTTPLKRITDFKRAFRGCTLKFVPDYSGSMLIVDRKSVVVKVDENSAVESNHEMFAQNMNFIFQTLWQKTQPPPDNNEDVEGEVKKISALSPL